MNTMLTYIANILHNCYKCEYSATSHNRGKISGFFSWKKAFWTPPENIITEKIISKLLCMLFLYNQSIGLLMQMTWDHNLSNFLILSFLFVYTLTILEEQICTMYYQQRIEYTHDWLIMQIKLTHTCMTINMILANHKIQPSNLCK